MAIAHSCRDCNPDIAAGDCSRRQPRLQPEIAADTLAASSPASQRPTPWSAVTAHRFHLSSNQTGSSKETTGFLSFKNYHTGGSLRSWSAVTAHRLHLSSNQTERSEETTGFLSFKNYPYRGWSPLLKRGDCSPPSILVEPNRKLTLLSKRLGTCVKAVRGCVIDDGVVDPWL